MPFREKSAWIMTIALLAGTLLYLGAVLSGGPDGSDLASPQLPGMLAFTAVLVVIAAAGHIVIAALAPREANAPADERERQIFDRAGRYSAHVTTTGIVLSLGVYLLSGSGDLLFYTALASLVIGQLAAYLLQVLFYRTSI